MRVMRITTDGNENKKGRHFLWAKCCLSFQWRKLPIMPQSQFEGHFMVHTNSAFKSAERLFAW